MNLQKFILWMLLLTPAFVLAWGAWRATAFLFRGAKKVDQVEAPVTSFPVVVPVPVAVPDVDQMTMVVRDVNEKKGTVIIRYRPSKKLVTAMLIIWAGNNKRRKKLKGEDSYYVLGSISAEGVTNEVVASVIEEANNKFRELANKGKKAEPDVAESSNMITLPVVVQGSDPAAPVVMAASQVTAVVVEDNEEHDPAIKLRRHPAVFRGTVLEAGMMKRPLSDKIIDQYGIRYQTPEGVEDAVWGSDLKRAIESANATVGDLVEILKVGRKTVEKGKAPMNMYKVAKISMPSVA